MTKNKEIIISTEYDEPEKVKGKTVFVDNTNELTNIQIGDKNIIEHINTELEQRINDNMDTIQSLNTTQAIDLFLNHYKVVISKDYNDIYNNNKNLLDRLFGRDHTLITILYNEIEEITINNISFDDTRLSDLRNNEMSIIIDHMLKSSNINLGNIVVLLSNNKEKILSKNKDKIIILLSRVFAKETNKMEALQKIYVSLDGKSSKFFELITFNITGSLFAEISKDKDQLYKLATIVSGIDIKQTNTKKGFIKKKDIKNIYPNIPESSLKKLIIRTAFEMVLKENESSINNRYKENIKKIEEIALNLNEKNLDKKSTKKLNSELETEINLLIEGIQYNFGLTGVEGDIMNLQKIELGIPRYNSHGTNPDLQEIKTIVEGRGLGIGLIIGMILGVIGTLGTQLAFKEIRDKIFEMFGGKIESIQETITLEEGLRGPLNLQHIRSLSQTTYTNFDITRTSTMKIKQSIFGKEFVLGESSVTVGAIIDGDIEGYIDMEQLQKQGNQRIDESKKQMIIENVPNIQARTTKMTMWKYLDDDDLFADTARGADSDAIRAYIIEYKSRIKGVPLTEKQKQNDEKYRVQISLLELEQQMQKTAEEHFLKEIARDTEFKTDTQGQAAKLMGEIYLRNHNLTRGRYNKLESILLIFEDGSEAEYRLDGGITLPSNKSGN